FWPKGREPIYECAGVATNQIRGPLLADLYASIKVVVGDSCLLPGDHGRYWSDRIPETLGRGGFLLHPWVGGIDDHFTDGEHLRLWPAGDWRELQRLIEHYLRNDDERRRIAEAGRLHVLENHTYTVRVRQLLERIGLEAAA
ncbi:MAG: glycosyltransferase, partial [Thermoleophilaceae bacterium]